jgi:hypothetical protein
VPDAGAERARLCLAALLFETMREHGPRVTRQIAVRARARAEQAPDRAPGWPRDVDGTSAAAALRLADEMIGVEENDPHDRIQWPGSMVVEDPEEA